MITLSRRVVGKSFAYLLVHTCCWRHSLPFILKFWTKVTHAFKAGG